MILAAVFNTAIKPIVDRIRPEHAPLSGLARDLECAAGSASLRRFPGSGIPAIWQLLETG